MSQGFDVRRDGAIVRVTLNRPDAGNMLTLAAVGALAGAVREAGADPSVKAIVLRGAGPDFCRGRDPAGAPEGKPTNAVEMRSALVEPILGLYRAVRDAAVPVIAVTQGQVRGLGCGVAAVCDVGIAADSARFALPEMKANLPPTLAMLAHLDRIPSKALLWMVLSTGEIDARQALGWGLISAVVPAAALEAQADAFLKGLVAFDRDAVATCKSFLQRARQADYNTANDLSANLLSVVLSSR
jgi:enoyl-CoA hydratase